MAFRTTTQWKSMVSRLGGGIRSSTFATSTSPKMKAYSPSLDYVYAQEHRGLRGDFVPVYVSIGMILMSVSLGLLTAMHQLKRAPNVQVRKSRRETIPELVEPERVVDEADQFLKKSFFRKVAHIQEPAAPKVPDYIRGEAFARRPHAETLKSVGVDPSTH
ncbi:uncharacterized protein LOC127795878 [Diospyros lotus]|uniref:uncharacterized protein LOC127795878 n=1 Tax=Diospyros lotus TaxID=55363 RepID=UPI002259C21D|nr:uncharacterized protein LOC127795878 [Diospyros lotus]